MKSLSFFSCCTFLLLSIGSCEHIFSHDESSSVRLIVKSPSRFKKNVSLSKKLSVDDKAYFDDEAYFKDDVTIKKNLIVDGGILVEDDLNTPAIVIVNGTVGNLSVTNLLAANNHSILNQTVGGTLSASEVVVDDVLGIGCNIVINNTTSTIGTINKKDQQGNELRFIHNFGSNNTFAGVNAGNFSMSGDSNTAIGVAALEQNTSGVQNTAVGRGSLNANQNGNNNTAIGAFSLANNVSGSDNTVIGFKAAFSAGSNSENTIIGDQAFRLSTGNKNVIIGGQAASSVDISSSVIIGYQAASQLLNGTNNIYIGSSASLLGPESDYIRIGALGDITACYIPGIREPIAAGNPVLVDDFDAIGSIPSSKRFKHSIKPMQNESVAIYDLSPVSFAYNHDSQEAEHYGLIAEDVLEVFPELVVKDQEGLPLTVRYDLLPILLLNEFKKQRCLLENLESKIDNACCLNDEHEDIEYLKNKVAALSIVYTALKKDIEKMCLFH